MKHTKNEKPAVHFYINQSLDKFKGQCLLINGDSSDIKSLIQDGYSFAKEDIYTIHHDQERQPDLVGNLYAELTYTQFPPAYFKLIYVKGLETVSEDKRLFLFLQIKRLLKPNGTFVYNGSFEHQAKLIKNLQIAGFKDKMHYCSAQAERGLIFACKHTHPLSNSTSGFESAFFSELLHQVLFDKIKPRLSSTQLSATSIIANEIEDRKKTAQIWSLTFQNQLRDSPFKFDSALYKRRQLRANNYLSFPIIEKNQIIADNEINFTKKPKVKSASACCCLFFLPTFSFEKKEPEKKPLIKQNTPSTI